MQVYFDLSKRLIHTLEVSGAIHLHVSIASNCSKLVQWFRIFAHVQEEC